MEFIVCEGRGPRLLVRREGVLVALLIGSFEDWEIDCDMRGNSTEPRGVETVDSVF